MKFFFASEMIFYEPYIMMHTGTMMRLHEILGYCCYCSFIRYSITIRVVTVLGLGLG
jgi:hypothetical protein